jgi:CheY-like chemotaxis protein
MSHDDGRNEKEQMARKHVLVVNGAPEFLDFIRILFQEDGYNVTTTNFVPRTFELIDALRPDLVIVDLVIGQDAGWSLLTELHDAVTTRKIPLLLTSTIPSILERAQEEQARYGAHRVIAKPMDIEELLKAAHELIGLA